MPTMFHAPFFFFSTPGPSPVSTPYFLFPWPAGFHHFLPTTVFRLDSLRTGPGAAPHVRRGTHLSESCLTRRAEAKVRRTRPSRACRRRARPVLHAWSPGTGASVARADPAKMVSDRSSSVAASCILKSVLLFLTRLRNSLWPSKILDH
jgi:hypothetical protein